MKPSLTVSIFILILHVHFDSVKTIEEQIEKRALRTKDIREKAE